jgi:flagellar hook protein FlgE
MGIRYKLNYDDAGSARQIGEESFDGDHVATPVKPTLPGKARRQLPSAVHTAITVIICGGVFFGAVAFAPEGWRPQDFTGTYVGDVASQVKAKETDIQAQLEAYNAQLRVSAEQQSARMKAVTEGIIRAYTAAYDLNRVQVEANNALRSALVSQQMSQTAQVNSSNLSIASIAELIGQGMNLFEPGSGSGALRVAEEQRQIAADRMQSTAIDTARVDVAPYVAQLPNPDVIAKALNSVPAMDIPPPPKFSKERE